LRQHLLQNRALMLLV